MRSVISSHARYEYDTQSEFDAALTEAVVAGYPNLVADELALSLDFDFTVKSVS